MTTSAGAQFVGMVALEGKAELAGYTGETGLREEEMVALVTGRQPQYLVIRKAEAGAPIDRSTR